MNTWEVSFVTIWSDVYPEEANKTNGNREKLEAALAEGWEPFAVTRDLNNRLCYHLRRIRPHNFTAD